MKHTTHLISICNEIKNEYIKNPVGTYTENKLKEQNKNIIIENEKAEEDDYSFVIGRIIKATKTKVVMQHFDADGIWEEELYEIPYSKITSVSFDTRYVNVFSKYL